MVSRLTNARRVSSATFDIRHMSKSSDIHDVTTTSPRDVGMQSREARVLDDTNMTSGLGLVSSHGGLQDNVSWVGGMNENTIYHIQDHIKIGFEDIFYEPDALRVGDIGRYLSGPVRRVCGFVFVYSQDSVYYFLTILVGFALSLAWGAVFAILSFTVVWILQPVLTLTFILLRVLAMPVRAFIRTLADPVFESIGQIFGFISARLKVRSMSASVDSPDETMEAMTRHGYSSEAAEKFGGTFFRSDLEGSGVNTVGRASKSYLDRPREWFGFV